MVDCFNVRNTKLQDKAALSSDNRFNGRQFSVCNYGVSPDGIDYEECNFVAIAETSSFNPARAKIGLHNVGANAGYLWLQTDGALRWTDWKGNKYKINMTKV
ncbi:MAG: hypothetical protein KH441_12880 [Clostridium sp.]|nr:hypothetical protein [Clostridium sp.]